MKKEILLVVRRFDVWSPENKPLKCSGNFCTEDVRGNGYEAALPHSWYLVYMVNYLCVRVWEREREWLQHLLEKLKDRHGLHAPKNWTSHHSKTHTLFFSSFSKGSKTFKTCRYGPSSQPGTADLSIAIMALTTYGRRWFQSTNKYSSCMEFCSLPAGKINNINYFNIQRR